MQIVVRSLSYRLPPHSNLESDRQHQSIWRLIDGSSSLQRCPNRCLRCGVLMSDGGTGECKASQSGMPQRMNVWNEVSRLMVLHGNINEADNFAKLTKLAGIREAKDRKARWDLGRRCGSDLGNGLTKKPLNTLPTRIIPPRQREPRAGPQSTNTFCDGGFRTREMSQPEIADNRIKRTVPIRQVLNVCHPELDAGIRAFGQLNHSG